MGFLSEESTPKRWFRMSNDLTTNQLNTLEDIDPKFNDNYKPGYFGFTFDNNSFISKGIIWFTKKPDHLVKVSHVFIVEHDGYGIEATLNKKVDGVHRFEIQQYFNNPHTHVFFKKPRGLKPEYTDLILAEANRRIGNKYDSPLFAGFVLRWILKPLENSTWLRRKPSIFNSSNKDICSELASICLNEVQFYRRFEPLKSYHSSKIDPVRLCNAERLWQEWTFPKSS